MADDRTRGRSRVKSAILFILGLIVGFAVLGFIFSALFGGDDEDSALAGLLESANKIAVIPIEGTISTSDDILKQLRKYRKKSSVKAIILRINSPGGAVAPAQEIYREVERTRKKKPVVASMETVAASAAYYISSNTDSIVCSKGTITGSIGVIMFLPDVHKVIERLGVNINIIKAGRFKDIGTGVRPLTEKERDLLKSFAEQVHDQFIVDVAKGRKGKISEEKVREIADGSFFSGETALSLGLVDSIGNFYDAVDVAAKLGEIEGKPDLIYPPEEWPGLLGLLAESFSTAAVDAVERSLIGRTTPVMR